MVDSVTPKRRSEIMSLVRAKNSRPELAVRRLLHANGYRYRLHARDLPGRPDLVFRRQKKVMFVHGCFWHRHENCALARLPKSRLSFWLPKLEKNRERDEEVNRELRQLGWRVLTVWECELANTSKLLKKLERFLDEKR